MIYEINDSILCVINKIPEYDEIIFGRFSQFKTTKEKADDFLIFDKNQVLITIKKREIILNNKIVKTDIYTIINNIIALLLNNENNIFIHSVVISNKRKGILLVGDFGQGKTTLANEMLKYGYEINSTDQTWVNKCNGKLYQKIGSRYYIEDEKINYLSKELVLKNIEITKIIRLIGLCDNGDVLFKEQLNLEHKIKNLYNYCNWSYNTPLFTDEQRLFELGEYIKKFWLNINVPLLNVRGDKNEISKILIKE